MRILEVEVRHWRGLNARLRLDAQGVVVDEPNEGGKSRLAEAVLFALTESAKGTARYKERLRTLEGQHPPFVRLRFEHAGARWELRKTYLTRGNEAVLRKEGSDETWRGDQADEKLAELVGAQPTSGKKRAPGLWSGAEGLGPWPLLVVRQRTAHLAPIGPEGLPEDGYATVRSILQKEIGEALAGPRGEALLRRLQERLAPLAPDRRSKRGAPVGRKGTPLGEAEARHEQALEAWREAWEAWREALKLGERIAEAAEAAEAAERQRADVAERLQQVEGSLRELQLARQRLEEAERARKEAADAHTEAERRLRRRAELERTLAERHARRQELLERLDALGQEQQQGEARLREARQRRERHQERAQRATERLRALEAARRRHELREELRRMRRDAEQAGEALEALRRAESALEALQRYDRNQRKKLRRRLDGLQEAEAALRREAVRLRIHPAREDLRLDGEALSAGTPHELEVLEQARLTLEDARGTLLDVEVVNRGAGVEELQKALRKARASFEKLARELDLPAEPSEAMARFEEMEARREEAQQEAARARARLAARLPDCPEEADRSRFVEALEAQRGRVEALQRKLDDEEGAPDEEPPEEARLEEARRELREAEKAQKEAEREEGELLATLDGLRKEADSLRTKLESEEANVRVPEALLAELPAIEQLERTLAEAAEALRQREEQAEQAGQQLEALGGERLEAEKRDLEEARERLDKEAREAEATRQQLMGRRAQLVGEGNLRARLVERGTALMEASAALRRERTRVLALQRLHEGLQARRRAAEQAAFEPVFRMVQGTVRQVFGRGARLQVAVGEGRPRLLLQREAHAVEHELLSAGAQEQLALMVRVALARLWRKERFESETLPLLLDDPLSETDDRRLPEVAKLLADAAREGLQVVVFTCRADPYLKGAPGFDRVRLLPVEEG